MVAQCNEQCETVQYSEWAAALGCPPMLMVGTPPRAGDATLARLDLYQTSLKSGYGSERGSSRGICWKDLA